MTGKRPLEFWALCLALLVTIETGWCGQGVGKALEEALKSRVTGSVEEVTQHFQKAVEQTGNPAQKASVLFFLAEYQMEKQEWAKAIETYERILIEGTESDKGGAFYGAAQAYLMLDQPEKAKAICAELKASCPGNTMGSFAYAVRETSPNSVHAKLAGFFEEASAGEPGTTSTGSKPTQPKTTEATPEPTTTAEKPLTTMPPSETQEAKQPVVEEKPEENRFAVGAKGWHSDLAGHFDSKGMSLGLSNDTDIGAQTRLALNGSWKFSGKDQLRLDYSQFDHNGSLNKAVTFNKLLYTAGASVKVRTSFFDVGLARLLDESEHGSWKFLYGVKFSRSFMRLAQQLAAGTRAGELNQDFSVPYLGVEGNAKLSGNVTLNGSVKYFSLNRSGASVRLTDFDVALLFGRDYAKEPAGTEWYGTLGYRFFLLHGEADNDSAEIRYGGPTFGLEAKF